jgi:hypothetical protein
MSTKGSAAIRVSNGGITMSSKTQVAREEVKEQVAEIVARRLLLKVGAVGAAGARAARDQRADVREADAVAKSPR